jgi:hypothetical protein
MKASEYIKALQQLISEHGDCELVIWDKRFDEPDLLFTPKTTEVISIGHGMYLRKTSPNSSVVSTYD